MTLVEKHRELMRVIWNWLNGFSGETQAANASYMKLVKWRGWRLNGELYGNG
jgi:hypothetical protein